MAAVTDLTKRLLSHPSSLLLSSTIASTALGIGTAALQARILGPAGRGELATAAVPATMIAMLLCVGLPDFVARKAAQGADPRVLSKYVLLASLTIGFAALGPYIALARFQAAVGSDAWWLLVGYAVALPLFLYGYNLSGLAVGVGRWRVVAFVRIIPGALSLLALVAIWLSASSVGPLFVGMVLLILTALSPLIYLTQHFAFPFGKVTWGLIREASSFGLRGWMSGSVALLNQRIDLLMMTAMASRTDLGYYAVATTLAAILTAVANSIAMPARNKVSRGNPASVAQTTALTMLVVLVLALVVIAALPLLVSTLLGPAFLPAIPVTSVLLIMQVPLGGVVILTQSLIGAGFPGAPLGGELTALGATIVLIFLFFPNYGILASAFATGLGNILSLCVLLVLIRRRVTDAPVWRFFFIHPRDIVHLARNY